MLLLVLVWLSVCLSVGGGDVVAVGVVVLVVFANVVCWLLMQVCVLCVLVLVVVLVSLSLVLLWLRGVVFWCGLCVAVGVTAAVGCGCR